MKRFTLFILTLSLILNPFILTKTNASSTYKIYINNSKTNIQTTTQQGLIFVSEDLIRQMGDSISRQGNSVIVKKSNKELRFTVGKNSYTINGKQKLISSKKVYPKTIQNKVFLPLSVLQNELGYKVQIKGRNIYITKPTTNSTNNTKTNYNTNSVNNPNFKNAKLTGNPIYDYYLRKPYKEAGNSKRMLWTKLMPKLGIPQPGNDKLDLETGWVMPYLNTFATDNWEKDTETLKNSLEMHYFAPGVDKSIAYSPDMINGGWEVLQLNYSEEYKTYGLWYRYPYKDETDVNGSAIAKMNFIHPQILRFYFPTKWELIWDNVVGNHASGTLERGVIYQLDGREFIADYDLPVFIWSRKGEPINRKDPDLRFKPGYDKKTIVIK